MNTLIKSLRLSLLVSTLMYDDESVLAERLLRSNEGHYRDIKLKESLQQFSKLYCLCLAREALLVTIVPWS
jgi:hypothetical protein